jgi:hypothetical protein
MKAAFILSAIAQVASAHYFFDSVYVNGAAQSSYVRRSTRAVGYNPIKFSSNPAVDIRDKSYIDGPDAMCNQGAFTNAGKTQILTVAAGSEIKFRLGVGATMKHPGPGFVYMSRAPNDDVKSYDGSGDWFKIFEEGVCAGGDFTTTAWCTWDRNWIAAKIPTGTPPGEYLVRVEHIGVHRSHVNQPEHFVSCAQVKVTGNGNGTPGPMVKIPGLYKNTDPYAKFSIYGGRTTFPMPGPAVWNGSGTGSAPTSAAQPQPTTMATSARPVATTTKAASQPTQAPSNPGSGSGGAPLWGQCGGMGWTGPTSCSSGKCVASNAYYSQCLQ